MTGGWWWGWRGGCFLCFYLIAISTEASNKSKRENKETRVIVIGHRESDMTRANIHHTVEPVFQQCKHSNTQA